MYYSTLIIPHFTAFWKQTCVNRPKSSVKSMICAGSVADTRPAGTAKPPAGLRLPGALLCYERSIFLLCCAGKEVGEDGTGNVMPHGEHSAGNGSQRILCKVCGGQTGCKAGVLHAHLDGDRAALGGVQLEQLAHAKAGEVAQQVVQDDHHKDQQTAGHDLGAVGGDHGADDQHDGGSGDQRQHTDGFLGELMEEVIDHKAQCDGHQHHLDDGHEHAHGVHVNTLASVQQGEQRSEERSQHGGNSGHANGQCNVALGKVGHHVGRGAAGAGANQDHANGQLGGQVEHLRERPCQKRHEGKLCNAADNHVLRAAEHHLEVPRLQGKAHAEHHDAQQVIDPRRLYHAERAGEEQGTRGHHNNDGGHVLAHKVAYFFQCFHSCFSFSF